MAFSPNGDALAWTSSTDYAGGAMLHVLNLRTGREPLTLLLRSRSIHDVAFSPDGRLVAAAGGQPNGLALWSIADGALQARHALCLVEGGCSGEQGEEPQLEALAFSADGRLLASTSRTGSHSRLRIFDTATWQERAVRNFQGAAVRPAFSPDGQLLALAEADETGATTVVGLWGIPSGEDSN